jgi:hypothetical protein
MKFWQSILINACITALVVFAAIALFLPNSPPDKSKEIREALSKQMDGIQAKLSAIEGAISKQKKQAPLTTAPLGPTDNSKALSSLNRKLDMVLGKLAMLENSDGSARRSDTFRRSSAPPMLRRQTPPAFSAKGQNPSRWIDTLPEEKRQEVEIIFEDHLRQLREKLPPPDPDGRPPDREAIRSIVQESDLLLKQDLKAVLSEEEYQQFLDSHPQSSGQLPKPPTIQRNP